MEKRLALCCLCIVVFLSVGATANPPKVDSAAAQVSMHDVRLSSDSFRGDIPVVDATGKESVVAHHYHEYNMRPFNAPFIMDLLIGPAISLGSHGAHTDWAGVRPNAINWFTLRLSYYPLRHWGDYCSLAFSSYRPRRYWDEILGEPLIEPSSDGCFYSGGWFNCAGEIGVSYQVQYRRWVLQAHAGYGGMSITNREDVMGKYKEVDEYGGGIDPVFEVCRHIWSDYMAFGITFGYRLSRGVNVVFEVAYRHPFHRPVIWLSRYDGEVKPGQSYDDTHMPWATDEQKFVSSTPWCRDLSLSIGFQIAAETSSRPKRKSTASTSRLIPDNIY